MILAIFVIGVIWFGAFNIHHVSQANAFVNIANISHIQNNNQITLKRQAFTSSLNLKFEVIHIPSNTTIAQNTASTNDGTATFTIHTLWLHSVKITLIDNDYNTIDIWPSYSFSIHTLANIWGWTGWFTSANSDGNDGNDDNNENDTNNNDDTINWNNDNDNNPTYDQNNNNTNNTSNTNNNITSTNTQQPTDSNTLIYNTNPDLEMYQIYDDPTNFAQLKVFVDIPDGEYETLMIFLRNKFWNNFEITQPFLGIGINTYEIIFYGDTKLNSQILVHLDPFITKEYEEEAFWEIEQIYFQVADTQQEKKNAQQTYLINLWLVQAYRQCPPPTKTITVAVVDNAFDTSIPDLQDKIVYTYDIADNDTDVNPPTQTNARVHGGVCASIIAADAFNKQAIIGTSMNTAKIMAIKATSDSESNPANITAGIKAVAHAIEKWAQIINLSWWSHEINSKTLHKIIKAWYDRGIVFVASAWNYNRSDPFYPAAYPEVIGVWSVWADWRKSSFSNHWAWVNISSFGEQILWLTYDNSPVPFDGTSEAAPLIAGVIAYMMSLGYEASDIYNHIKSTEWFHKMGEGMLDISSLCSEWVEHLSSEKKSMKTQSMASSVWWLQRLEKNKMLFIIVWWAILGWMLLWRLFWKKNDDDKEEHSTKEMQFTPKYE